MLPQISGVTKDGNLRFNYVQPHQVRQLWPVLIDGINLIRKTNGESWLPEDIYAALISSKASLYTLYAMDGAFAGFGVFEVMMFTPFDASPCMNIWLGYSVDKGHGHYGVELAKQVAGAAGLERIVFSTPQENDWVKSFSKITTWYEVA